MGETTCIEKKQIIAKDNYFKNMNWPKKFLDYPKLHKVHLYILQSYILQNRLCNYAKQRYVESAGSQNTTLFYLYFLKIQQFKQLFSLFYLIGSAVLYYC